MKKADFKVGDAVFYPAAGVGVVEAMEDIYINGQWEQCFVIRICENRAVIRIPQSNIQKNGIRPLLQGKRLKELFKVLAAKPMHRATGNWAERYKDLERKINGGSCLELGEVVRDLTRWKQEKAFLSRKPVYYKPRVIIWRTKLPPFKAFLPRSRLIVSARISNKCLGPLEFTRG